MDIAFFWSEAKSKLGEDPLGPYKDVIIRWINPPDFCNPISVAKAKKAISDYKKALGQPRGLGRTHRVLL